MIFSYVMSLYLGRLLETVGLVFQSLLLSAANVMSVLSDPLMVASARVVKRPYRKPGLSPLLQGGWSQMLA